MADTDTTVRRGDIVIVDLDPTTEHEMQHTRPGVVVQNDIGNQHSHTTIVAPVTTTHRGYPFEVRVRAAASDFVEDSSVRLDQLRTVDIDARIRSVVGALSTATMREIDSALKLELGLG